MKKNTPKFILIAGLLVVVILFFVFDLGHYFTLENLKEHQQAFQDYYQQNKFMTIALYFLVYAVMAALSLPVNFRCDPFVCRLQKTDGLIAYRAWMLNRK